MIVRRQLTSLAVRLALGRPQRGAPDRRLLTGSSVMRVFSSGLGGVPPQQEEPAGRLMDLVRQLREETEPVRVEVQEPNVTQSEYDNIRRLQREHAELHQMGMNKKAFEAAHRVLDACVQNYGTLHPVTLSAMNNVALALKGNGQILEAKNIMVNVFEGYVKIFGQKHKHSLLAFHNLAKIYQQNREPDTAIKLCDEVLQLIPAMEEPDDLLLVQCKLNKSVCLRDLGRLDQSLALLRETLADVDRCLGGESLARATVLVSLGMTLKRLGKLAEAEKQYLEALRVRRVFLPEHHPEVMVCYHNLSILYEEMGDLVRSSDMQARAKSILKKVVQKDA